MRILVTGARGMLGTDLVPVLRARGNEVAATDIEEVDITVPAQIKEAVRTTRSEIIINCAAYTQVDKAEEEPDQAFLINGMGTENIALVCREFGIGLCHISTDYVFSGEKEGPYLPSDETGPINSYGASKLTGETAIRKILEKFFILRTSWLYGKNGKNFVHTIIGLAESQREIEVVDDQIGSPTWTITLADVISKIIRTHEYGIYHVTDRAGKGISWYRFGKEIVEYAGLESQVTPVRTDHVSHLARRPKNSVLDVEAIEITLKERLPEWTDSLKNFLSSVDRE